MIPAVALSPSDAVGPASRAASAGTTGLPVTRPPGDQGRSGEVAGPGPAITKEHVMECVASEVLVDPRPPLGATSAVCPACGQKVHINGDLLNRRYAIHNEPAQVDA